MRTNEGNHNGSNRSGGQGKKRTLRFRCPQCGGRDLYENWLLKCHPMVFIDKIEVNPDQLEDDDDVQVFCIGEGEHVGTVTLNAFEYACKGCGVSLEYEEDGKKCFVDSHLSLAHWLLKHCPESDGDDIGEQGPGEPHPSARVKRGNAETSSSKATGSDEPEELRFTCPECQGHALYLKQIHFTEVTDVYSDGHMELGDEFPEEDLGFVCQDCDYELLDEGGPIAGGKLLVEWLKRHAEERPSGEETEEDEVN